MSLQPSAINNLPQGVLHRILAGVIGEWGTPDVLEHLSHRKTLTAICRLWHSVISGTVGLNAQYVDLSNGPKEPQIDGSRKVILACRPELESADIDRPGHGCQQGHRRVTPAVLQQCVAIVACPAGSVAIQECVYFRLDSLQRVCILPGHKVKTGLVSMRHIWPGGPSALPALDEVPPAELTFLGYASRLESLQALHLLETWSLPRTPLTSLTRLELTSSELSIAQLLDLLQLVPHLKSFLATDLVTIGPHDTRLPAVYEEDSLAEIEEIVLVDVDADLHLAIISSIPSSHTLKRLIINGDETSRDLHSRVVDEPIYMYELLHQILSHDAVQGMFRQNTLTLHLDYGTVTIHGPDLHLLLNFGTPRRLVQGLAFFRARGGWPSSSESLHGILHIGAFDLFDHEERVTVSPTWLVESLPRCISGLLCMERSRRSDTRLLQFLQSNPAVFPRLKTIHVVDPEYNNEARPHTKAVSKKVVDAFVATRPEVTVVHGTSPYWQRERELTEMLPSSDPSRNEYGLERGQHWDYE